MAVRRGRRPRDDARLRRPGRAVQREGQPAENWWEKADKEEYEKRVEVQVQQAAKQSGAREGAQRQAHVRREHRRPRRAQAGAAPLRQRAAAAGGEAPKINGFTPEQRFFLAWAQVWRENVSKEHALKMLTVDPTAPTSTAPTARSPTCPSSTRRLASRMARRCAWPPKSASTSGGENPAAAELKARRDSVGAAVRYPRTRWISIPGGRSASGSFAHRSRRRRRRPSTPCCSSRRRPARPAAPPRRCGGLALLHSDRRSGGSCRRARVVSRASAASSAGTSIAEHLGVLHVVARAAGGTRGSSRLAPRALVIGNAPAGLLVREQVGREGASVGRRPSRVATSSAARAPWPSPSTRVQGRRTQTTAS